LIGNPDGMPARWLPLLYFGFAHLSFASALAVALLDPLGLAGFFYHPRMVAVVHLVTLGWITGSILGAIYVVGPLALRMPLPAGRLDGAAFAAFGVGVAGMVSHFWLDSPSGMAWSAALVMLALMHVSARVLAALRSTPIPREVKLHVGLAFVNVLVAAVAGLLLGINKVAPFLPSSHLSSVFGHAHLAALGWGTMMVMGAGYRLLPMVLPAAMPVGRGVYASALLLEAGALGLFAAFLAGGARVAPFAVLAVAGVAAFLIRVVWMFRHRRPPPSGLLRPDFAAGHAVQALLYLVAASLLGLWLAFAQPSEGTLRGAMAYGVLGLVGFLSQIVVGIEGRLLPLYAWLWGFADREQRESPPSLHAAPVRALQAAGFLLWTAGVPLLAAGLSLERPALVRSGAGALLAGVAASAANGVMVVRKLWGRPPRPAGGGQGL
jgi:hypothetical protein